jgi:hypothetical protein
LLTLDEFRFDRTLVATRGERLALTHDLVTFRDRDYGPAEVAAYNVCEIDERGLVTRIVAFAPEELENAIGALDARHTEILTETSAEAIAAVEIVPPNMASRTLARYLTACGARDFAAMRECLAEDAVSDERRRRLGPNEVLVGRDAIIDSLAMTRELQSLRCETQTVATRGERLALLHQSFFMVDRRGGEGALEWMNVVEVDEAGRIVSLQGFEPADRAAAFFELDARWLDREGAPYATLLTPAQSIYTAFHADPDRFAASLADDLVVVDHRILGWGVLDKAAYAQLIGFMMDLGGGLEQLTFDAIAPQGLCATCRGFGIAEPGGEYEVLFCCVSLFDGDLVTRIEYFDVDDRDAAIARLHDLATAREALSARHAEIHRSDSRPNVASQVVAEQDAAFARRDREAVMGAHAPGFVLDDRRPFFARVFTEEESLGTVRYALDLDGIGWERRVVATRGERLVLVEDNVSSLDGEVEFEMQTLTLVELDRDGLVIRHTAFEPEALADAIADLEARSAALDAELDERTREGAVDLPKASEYTNGVE